MMTHTKETVQALLDSHLRAPCSCGRNGEHRVCPTCAAHADAMTKEQREASRYLRHDHGECPCNADEPTGYRPILASNLSPWDLEFLRSTVARMSAKRAKPQSAKVLAQLDRIAAKVTTPAAKRSTCERDALDVSPKRGRTWTAMVKACRFSLVKECLPTVCDGIYGNTGTPHAAVWFVNDDAGLRVCPTCGRVRQAWFERVDMYTNPSREIVEAVRADIRAQISDATGWDKLPNAEAFSDAMRVTPEKSALGKVLAQLLDWHKYAVNVGILTLAA